ncbi:MAG: NeuD/PglB/VioB family sugar acetyltransferase, partial [bacterium]|nr:NeuD/PglB/VioB family sugar acetyltransferase [bacterium]
MSVPVKVIGLGAGGHAKLVIDTLQEIGIFEIVGLVDPRQELWMTSVLGVRVLGGDEQLLEYHNRGVTHVFVGVGSVGDTAVRRRVYMKAVEMGFAVISAVHPGAQVARSARLGAGTVVMAQAVVGPDARLGENVAVNSGALVEHDCVIGNHVQVASGARLGGSVRVGAGAHIGIGASVRQGIEIGEA